MAGRIYISSAFKSLKRAVCQKDPEQLDNDPHFWNSPPTWGICRTDYRKNCNEGDYIFFVLPKENNTGKQCIYAYLKVERIISHVIAYTDFPQKRMGKKNPNGNIIVDAKGNYNLFDRGIHKDRFSKIKKYYVVGEKATSRFLKESEIQTLGDSFNKTLNRIFMTQSKSNFDIITRKGRVLTTQQVKSLLKWINSIDKS